MRHRYAFTALAALPVMLLFAWSTRDLAVHPHDTPTRPDSLTAISGAIRTAPDSLITDSAPAESGRFHSRSRIIIPVEGVRPDQLVDSYNFARSEGRIHRAIDIMAPLGTRVLAAADGKITRLDTNEHGGLTIYQLTDDARTVYYYAHLSGYAPGLRSGQHVRQGDHIGYVGDTGNAAPGNYHLHFAIWSVADSASLWKGRPLNPYPLLQPTRWAAASYPAPDRNAAVQ